MHKDVVNIRYLLIYIEPIEIDFFCNFDRKEHDFYLQYFVVQQSIEDRFIKK